ncbi:MAG: GNAT family N-acetyltransferase [Paracoccaceae bacterium]|jgi:ribosomal protein S18 acetylase RimI-like enzyme
MEITSKGLQSEFIFHGFGGVITDHGDCISVLSPNNPDYYFGNFLLYPAPPKVGDFKHWTARFGEIFGANTGVRHHTFQWIPGPETGTAAIDEFRQAGFTVDETSVLSTKTVSLDKPTPRGVEFRKIRTDVEWTAVVDSQSREGFPGVPMDDFRHYKETAFANYRNMSEQGFGDWWGAFKSEKLVANMGLFFGQGVGRFQSVGTDPEHRRQGICRAMVHHVSSEGLAAHPDVTLILHADAHDVARGIYCSVGYSEIEHLQSVFRAPILV